jgi:predicted pyridoxine 5'-phosphate oxidase superfamily flavin-nucleotide-binding protein
VTARPDQSLSNTTINQFTFNNCSKGDIEDEKHFIVDCPLYENIRVKFFDKVIDLYPNLRYMDTSSKFVWLFTNEHEQVFSHLI